MMRDSSRSTIVPEREVSGQIAEVGSVIVLFLASVVIGIDVLLLTNNISSSINIFEVGLVFVAIAQIFGTLTIYDLVAFERPSQDITMNLAVVS